MAKDEKAVPNPEDLQSQTTHSAEAIEPENAGTEKKDEPGTLLTKVPKSRGL